jgi:predicted metal-dependent HD superfamily phosphohydrolase
VPGPRPTTDAIDTAARDLLARWSEPQRRYHDATHLTAVLDVVDRYADLAAHPDRVRLAAWLHDAVYDPRADAGINERDSAVLATDLLTRLGVPPEVATDVATLVALTDGHAAADGDPDGSLLCDADLAILAADPDRYAAYAAAIRDRVRARPGRRLPLRPGPDPACPAGSAVDLPSPAAATRLGGTRPCQPDGRAGPAELSPPSAILELWLPIRHDPFDSFPPQLQDRGERVSAKGSAGRVSGEGRGHWLQVLRAT